MDENSRKKIWEKLESQFMSKTATTKVYLKQKLYGMKMQEGSDLVEYMNAFNQVMTDLACLGATIDDEDRVIQLLCSLPSSYDHLITSLTHGKETVKNEDITAALLSYHMRKKNAVEVTHGEGLPVKGEEWRKGYEAGKNKKKKNKVQCHKCKQRGHIKKDCRELNGGSSANMAIHGDDSDNSSDALVVSDMRSTKSEAWMLDSACSFHATPNKEWFSSYKSGDFGLAYMGDDTGYRVAGVGDIKIKMFDGVERMLRGVRHVPGVRRNLISLGVLHDDGTVFRCDRDKKIMEIMEDDVTVIIGARMASHLYKLQESTIAGGVTETGVARVAAGSHGGGGSGADSSGSSW
ncbi:putative retrovirus-related pol polyprotein [Hordeum vulgare]|nr:putative retrovirus-related pol polyprotein [Hordeum vulgare]